jgi:hypothetical protein
VVSFCILAFFACNEKIYSQEALTALPFDFVEWGKWQAEIDITETKFAC